MLEIIGVSKAFGGKPALIDAKLTVADGEFVSILGPSGCGKTTLLRIIGGLEQPDSGTLRLDTQDITRVAPHKRNIHTVFQRYALFPHMNVFDNIAFGLRCKKTPETEIKKRVEESLELANLPGQGHRAIATLSGGEQQRVALVRALVNVPKLLLLDEPLGALDAKLRLQIQQELVAIQKRVKTTFVFVTHDQQEALTMSDRVVVMKKGLIEQVGTPNEIYELPKSYYVAHFVGGINSLKGTIRLTEGRAQFEVEGLGLFNAEPNAEMKVDGKTAMLCVRPEKLTVYARKPSSAENTVDGVLKTQTYLGTHTQFDVQLKNGTIVNVFTQNSQRASRRELQVGDRVFLGWQTSMSHVFDNEALP